MKEIKLVIPEDGEKILSGAANIHTELLKLPAGMYVNLYHMMKSKIENTYFSFDGAKSSCGIISKPIQV